MKTILPTADTLLNRFELRTFLMSEAEKTDTQTLSNINAVSANNTAFTQLFSTTYAEYCATPGTALTFSGWLQANAAPVLALVVQLGGM